MRRFAIAGFATLLILLMVSADLEAQVPGAYSSTSTDLNPGEGIVVGPFIFSPSVQLTWERRDNIFFTQGAGVEDDILTAQARFGFELPYHNAYVEFAYTPKYREYMDHPNIPEDKWSHFVDLKAGIEFANGFELDATLRWMTATLETPEVDAGYEHVYGYYVFEKSQIGLAGSYWITPTDAISLQLGHSDVNYDRPQAETYWYDYSTEYYGAAWVRQLNPTTQFDVRYRHSEYNSEQTLSYRDSSSDELTVGINGQLTENLSSQLRVGWRETSYDTRAADPNYVEDFSSFVAEGFLSWELAHGSTLTLGLRRSDFASAWADAASYDSLGARLTYNLNRDKLFASASIGVQENDYGDVVDPRTGRRRKDDLTVFNLGLGYWFTDRLSLRGSYSNEDRDSLNEFSYDSSAFMLGLAYGY